MLKLEDAITKTNPIVLERILETQPVTALRNKETTYFRGNLNSRIDHITITDNLTEEFEERMTLLATAGPKDIQGLQQKENEILKKIYYKLMIEPFDGFHEETRIEMIKDRIINLHETYVVKPIKKQS